MAFNSAAVKREYEFCLETIGEDEFQGVCKVGLHDVVRAHYLLVDYFYSEGQDMGGVGPKSIDLLSSAIARQVAGFGGKRKWIDDFDICATLYYGLIKNHPFHDCNKRTALLTALYYLQQIRRIPTVKLSELEKLTLSVAESKLNEFNDWRKYSKLDDPEIRFISNYFRKNTRALDKRYYAITYRHLNEILHKNGYRLDNQKGAYIDVVVDTEKGFFIKKTTTKRIGQIGFQGWNKIVSPIAIRQVRKLTNLTDEYGADSQTFINGSEIMYDLIETYQKPLRRLANK